MGSVLNRPKAALSQFERSTVMTGASSSSSEIAISLAVTPRADTDIGRHAQENDGQIDGLPESRGRRR